MSRPSTLELILRKDRVFLIGGLIALTALSWWYIIYLYHQMYPMNMDALFFAMPMNPQWTLVDFVLLFLMWLVMMIAMMTPSIAPLVLVFAMVNRRKQEVQNPYTPTGFLVTGYFLVWAVFSLIATLLQWGFQKIEWLNPEMIVTNKIVAAFILIAAGLFQFTALKVRCLNHCRNPIDFIHKKWKNGQGGALRMGIENGFYCLGCCWVLMALLFVTGIMNVLWIALLAIFVLIEKLFPRARLISYTAGFVLMVYGGFVLFR